MNNYQIYDEVGKGRHSVVYKGRRKKSIEYYAIASIDKSQRQRVLCSVQFLRSLQHRNVLKFHNWYETNNHLWVITEYCIGGDLRAVLDLDQRLSENAVRILGIDLVEGLMHIHSRGIIYGDLKPSNVLMDATASLRYYDFGLASTFENALQASKVGTPSYMAPELFRDGGFPSMASDLWSLGCVLYEMATGKPPFTASTIQGLIQKIVNEPFKRIESFSSAFHELMDGLLQKDPLERITWKEVLASDVWQASGSRLSPLPAFPAQPAFEALKKQAAELKRPMSKEVERRNRDIMRASINAERNLARELAQAQREQVGGLDSTYAKVSSGQVGGGTAGAGGPSSAMTSNQPPYAPNSAGSNSSAAATSVPLGGVLHIDREVDFSDHQPDAASTDPQQPQPSPLTQPVPMMAIRPQSGGAVTTNAGATSATAQQASAEPSAASTFAVDPTPKNQPLGSNAAARGGAGTELTSRAMASSPAHTVEELLTHPSDAHIRPLVMNARIEKYAEQKYEPATLGFQPLTLSALKQQNSRDLEGFLTTVFKALSGTSDLAETLNVLSYFETLCADAAIANVVINSSVMSYCVKSLAHRTPAGSGGSSNSSSFHCAIASIMGLLVRHATFIHSDLAKSGVLDIVVEALNEEQHVKTIRKLLACLGELLFYIGTQSAEERAAWPIPYAAVRGVYLRLMQHEDDVVKHYAVKAVENLASIADRAMVRNIFATIECVQTLLWVYSLPLALPARNEHLKSSAVCAAMKLCYSDDQLLPTLLFSTVFPLRQYGELLTTSNPKIVQILATTVTVLLWRLAGFEAQQQQQQQLQQQESASPSSVPPPSFGKPATPVALAPEVALSAWQTILQNTSAFLDGIRSVMENNLPAIRAKGLLAAALLSSVQHGVLLDEFHSKAPLFQCMDKLVKDRDPAVQRVVPTLSAGLSAYVHFAVERASKPEPGLTWPPSALETTLHLVTTTHLRALLVITESFFVSLAQCVQQCNVPATSAAYSQVEQTLHHIVEALAADGAIRSQHYLTLVSTVLPPFRDMLGASEGASRFLAMQMILHVLTPILQDSVLYNPASSTSPLVGVLHPFVASTVPYIAGLLQDGEPIPVYTLKFMSLCCEKSPALTLQFLSDATMNMLLVFFDPNHASHSVYVVRLLLRILQCGGDERVKYGAERGIIPTLLACLKHADAEGAMDSFAEPCFELAFFILCEAVNDPSSIVAQQASHFIVNRNLESLFFPACTAKMAGASECAASCVFLLSQLFSEARQSMLQPSTLAVLREVFSDVDSTTVHTALPLLRSLLMCVTACSNRSDLRSLLQDEPLLVALQEMADRGELSAELASQSGQLLQTLCQTP